MSTVLFVSSDGAIAQMASQHLVAKGYDVLAASGATEALRSLHNLAVDAVIFDAAVRDMSAHDFCDRLRQDPQSGDVPMLFLVPPSFRWLPGSVPLRIGRDALASKPFDTSEIEQALTQLLGAPKVEAGKTLTVGGLCLDRGLFTLSGQEGSVTLDRKSTRLNSSHIPLSRMPSSA